MRFFNLAHREFPSLAAVLYRMLVTAITAYVSYMGKLTYSHAYICTNLSLAFMELKQLVTVYYDVAIVTDITAM